MLDLNRRHYRTGSDLLQCVIFPQVIKALGSTLLHQKGAEFRILPFAKIKENLFFRNGKRDK
jgi:hypothetical protein